MSEKSTTIWLAVLLGSTGSSAQFEGRKNLGYSLLVFSWAVLPSLAWVAVHQGKANPFMVAFILSLSWVIIHASMAVFHAKKQAPEQSIETVKTRSIRIAGSTLIAVLAAWGSFQLVFSTKTIDTSKAPAAFELTSSAFAAAFQADENSFRKKYEGEVVELQGLVLAVGQDFTEGSYLALEGVTGGASDVNCYFDEDRQDGLQRVAAGQTVTVVGVVQGRFLKHCYLQKIAKP